MPRIAEYAYPRKMLVENARLETSRAKCWPYLGATSDEGGLSLNQRNDAAMFSIITLVNVH